MRIKRQTKPQRKALKARGITPGKVAKDNPRGQARGGWSPFAPPAGRMDITDETEYDGFDRAKGTWFTHKPKGR